MKKAFLQLHISILLAGWTGVFGKLMMLSPGLIVFWRIVIAGGCLWLWGWLTKRLEKVTPRDRIAIMGVGALLAVQWTLFYASIKASNVSIGVVAFSSIGFFTALIEPLMNRARISLREMLFSLVTIFGISLIFHFDAQYRLGIALGLVGAAAAAKAIKETAEAAKDAAAEAKAEAEAAIDVIVADSELGEPPAKKPKNQ